LIDASVARRYARALLSLGLEEGRHERFGEEIEQVAHALADSGEARDLVQNPSYSTAQRQGVIDTLSAQLKLSPMVVNFLRLLVDRQRIAGLTTIARAYRELVDAQVGRVRAVVTSAQALSKDEAARVQQALAAATQRAIVLETRTDAGIVGGLVAQVGKTVWDGSLRTQLEKLREELKRGPI